MKKFDYNKLKKEVVIEHNRVRTNPKSYIPILEQYMKYFNGNVLEKPDSDEGIETLEGKHAYVEAIKFLKTQKPICKLEFNEELSRASQDHCNDIGKSGSCDHKGSDGSTNDDRIGRYLDWDIAIAENIDFGATSGEELIISLLVDDGIEDRGHRDTLFNTKVNYIGIGVGYHREYDVCTVIDYVGTITSYKNKALNKLMDAYDNAKKKENSKALMKAPVSTIRMGEGSSNHNKAIKNMLKQAQKKEMVKLSKDLKNCMLDDDEDNPFADDPDAPEGAISCKTKTITKTLGKKKINTTIKTYTLEDGSEETVTLEEIQY